MAVSAQSLRFGGGSFDALNRILADLCTRGNPKVRSGCVDFTEKDECFAVSSE